MDEIEDAQMEEEASCSSDINVEERIRQIKQGILPEKSRQLYEMRYRDFKDWVKQNNLRLCDDTVLAYFSVQSETHTPNFLFHLRSILASTLKIYDDFDIRKIPFLVDYCKQKVRGYVP